MKTLILCPGQGAQTVGMAKELIESDAASAKMFERATEILGWDSVKLCTDGPAEELNRTDRTQPALYLHSCAAIDKLRAAGLSWEMAAGHSAGEYAALYALKAWSFEEGLEVIAERARLMHAAGQECGGTMAVSLGLHPDKVKEACEAIEDVVVLANRNAPNQGVISGTQEGVKTAVNALKEAGAKRVLPLKVSGAFHSPLMQSAKEKFEAFLASRPDNALSSPDGIWISNRTGKPESDPAVIHESLAAQLISPVHWLETVDWLKSQTPLRCIEAGPGNVLRGLLKTNQADIPGWGAATPEEIENVKSEVQS